jgi:hypothetical protein
MELESYGFDGAGAGQEMAQKMACKNALLRFNTGRTDPDRTINDSEEGQWKKQTKFPPGCI